MNKLDIKWNLAFEEVKSFMVRYHRLPRRGETTAGTDSSRDLRTWLSTQRYSYSKGTLPETRANMLHSIGLLEKKNMSELDIFIYIRYLNNPDRANSYSLKSIYTMEGISLGFIGMCLNAKLYYLEDMVAYSNVLQNDVFSKNVKLLVCRITKVENNGYTALFEEILNKSISDVYLAKDVPLLRSFRMFKNSYDVISKSVLTDRELLFIKEYYLRGGTLDECAKLFDMSKQRVTQILEKAVRKLRKPEVLDHLLYVGVGTKYDVYLKVLNSNINSYNIPSNLSSLFKKTGIVTISDYIKKVYNRRDNNPINIRFNVEDMVAIIEKGSGCSIDALALWCNMPNA